MDADFKCRLKEEKEVEASLSIAAEQVVAIIYYFNH
jgi:hypothetical protein